MSHTVDNLGTKLHNNLLANGNKRCNCSFIKQFRLLDNTFNEAKSSRFNVNKNVTLPSKINNFEMNNFDYLFYQILHDKTTTTRTLKNGPIVTLSHLL